MALSFLIYATYTISNILKTKGKKKNKAVQQVMSKPVNQSHFSHKDIQKKVSNDVMAI